MNSKLERILNVLTTLVFVGLVWLPAIDI